MLAPAWPETGQHVTIIVGGEEQLAIVNDAEPPRHLVLREPVTNGPPATVGSRLLVLWSTDAGHHQLRATLAEAFLDRMPLWRLAELSTPVLSQRRAYTRAPDALPGELVRGRQRWSAVVADIGEGGARCVLEHAADLAAGDDVLLHIRLDGADLLMKSEVLQVDLDHKRRIAARLRFGDLGKTADLVRRRVLEQQRRARAAAQR